MRSGPAAHHNPNATFKKLECQDIEDLIHISGPLTEDAVMKTLQSRFNEKKYYVSRNCYFAMRANRNYKILLLYITDQRWPNIVIN